MALTQTTSGRFVESQQWADASLVLSETATDVPSASEVAPDACDVVTGRDGIVISGPRPKVEKYLERALVPIAALLDVYSDPVLARERFRELAETWLEESAHISSTDSMALLWSYQRIIGMGRDAVPLILERLREAPDHWFWALRAITGVNPVSPEHVGRIADMAQDWIQWGEENGMLD